MTRPNASPITHTTRPPISSVRPLMPWNVSVLRSGSTRFASPTTCCTAGAGAWAAGGAVGGCASAIAGSITISASHRQLRNVDSLIYIVGCLWLDKTPDYTPSNAEISHAIVAAARPDASRERHAAGEKDANALLDRDVRIRRAVARYDDDVAKVEVVGGDVHRDEHF